MNDKNRQLIGYAFLAMIISVCMLCIYLESTEETDTALQTDDKEIATTDIYFYTNGTNITRLEVDQRYLRINGRVYMKDFALHDYPVFEEHEIIVIPDDRQPKVYFETKTVKRCNEAVLIGDKNCYNHSYLEIHLLVDSDTAGMLSAYGYYSIPDLSDYEIVYSEEMYR